MKLLLLFSLLVLAAWMPVYPSAIADTKASPFSPRVLTPAFPSIAASPDDNSSAANTFGLAAPRSCADATDPNLIVTPANLPLPSVGKTFVDSNWCVPSRRVSNTSDQGDFETQEYSQLQAFSADNAYLLLVSSNGYLVRRMSNLSQVAGLDTASWNAARWYPPQPHTLVHFDDNGDATLRVQLSNIDTLTTATIYTFPAPYERVITNRSSDELAEDGSWMAGVAQRADGSWVIFSFDLLNRTLAVEQPINDLYSPGPCAPDPDWGIVMPDWVGVSPLGRYLVVQWTRDGTQRCSGLETFDIQTGAFVGRVYDGHQHGDLGVQPDGDTEFFMTFELYHPSGNMALGVRELPGTATVSAPNYVQVLDWGNGEHISCRGPRGVCLVTAGSDPANGWGPFEGELFLQYTDGSAQRLAHHRSSSCGYWVQPRASQSRNGRYVVFASDWDRQISCGDLGRGDPYVLDLQVIAPRMYLPYMIR
ncbi:MAG: hypothetical protein HY741_25355 [Chloroflexi bacterium]|nr:hypothetical protein [Chloroflexota bacterium]